MDSNLVGRTAFRRLVWDYYSVHARVLPWRVPEQGGEFSGYKILVSEVMLQQTQVRRVIPKYQAFLEQFPEVEALAKAPLSEVLIAWSGLGYNRRAKYLHDAVKMLANVPEPWSIDVLKSLKGIGPNTAAAVCVYTYNQPQIFIETNIRSVYIHYFFADQVAVTDKAILSEVTTSLDDDNPREWYWALMDYGNHLKSITGNTERRAKAYAKQSTFIGSRRQLRGLVIRELGSGAQTLRRLQTTAIDDRLEGVLNDLVQEGLVAKQGNNYSLA
jgi:A/G-specific adenine glycosylase